MVTTFLQHYFTVRGAQSDMGGDPTFWGTGWGFLVLMFIFLSCQFTVWCRSIGDSVAERLYCWVMSICCVIAWGHVIEDTEPHFQMKIMITATAVWLSWRCLRKILTPRKPREHLR